MKSGQLLIAEVKTASPYGWRSEKSWDELFELACEFGDIVAVHTDPRWDGSFELLAKARSRTRKPILAKGIHATDQLVTQALDAGADYVLVVGRLPEKYSKKMLLEPTSLEQLATFPAAAKVVWNSRDLTTGSPKAIDFEQARILWPGWLCQASNIRSGEDVHSAAEAILVGSHLPEFVTTIKK